MPSDINLFTIFTTGLLTGGLSCMAVQGGLLTATLAQREEEKIKEKAKGKMLPIASFLIAKLLAYTLLGFFLGWIGSVLQLNLQTQVIVQFAVVVFMLGTALNLLHVHPIFRYFVLQPPRFLTRFIRQQSKRGDIFVPALMGALTIFIPCGTTQAMMALAVASGKPIAGAAILYAFVFGTIPLFFILGYVTMKLGDVFQQSFGKVAALVILLIAVFTFDGALALTGTPYTMTNLTKDGFCFISFCDDPAYTGVQQVPVTEQTITITPSGYSPDYIAVPKGTKVTFHLVNNAAFGCLQAFTIPALNIQKIVEPNKSGDLTFMTPAKPGRISFMCSQGLHPGVIDVL